MKNNFISSIWQFDEQNYDKIHNIFRWYGKLPPQLVNKLINLYSNENDKILANFWGSWTILIESIINKRFCDSYDINPTAILIWNIKVNSIETNIDEIIKKIEIAFKKESNDYSKSFDEYEKKWFNQETLNSIYKIKQIINDMFKNESIYNYLMFNLISIIRKCSLVDSRCINHIVVDKNKKILEPLEEFFLSIKENFETINDFNKSYNNNFGSYKNGDAREIKSEEWYYDLVISHPPYLWNVNYSNINQLQNYILWHKYSEIKTRDLSTESLKLYLDNMYKVIDEMIRVVKKWKKICLIIWDSRKNWDIIPTFSYFIKYWIDKWLKLKDIFIWVLKWKAWNSIKRHWNHIDHNYILIFEK